MELYKALVLPDPAVVLKGPVQGLLLGVEQDRHPLLAFKVSLSLEVVGSETRIDCQYERSKLRWRGMELTFT